MRAFLALPFSTPLSKRLMLVHHIGRKTGKEYRQPVSYVDDHGTLLTPGGGRWTDNLRPGEPVRIRLRGHVQMMTPDPVDDADEIDRLFAVMTKANPMLKRFVPIPRDPNGRLDRPTLDTAIRNGFRIVRWEPITSIAHGASMSGPAPSPPRP
jgi:deazaflavin-dependent oxidoreductase (nitroreductase family)